ncbi:xanthine dehydrogenase accessory factor [Rhodopirellula maiorica SM1]|uniref:Xanthine dehydrogenase accessory factor n=1 Tax=Rhodopirellula maiorica SM1 TaxID=1265738 RepID=M5RHT2_9BACT|nr:XdhC/CoxI family protein [Rhodopirellula maiorica]EMI18756.1 xanthine dehydrogenase accessory factor [Rhodopirellula maiorica SM1]
MRPLIQLAREAIEEGQACVLCTVVRLDGSGYGRPGARLLLTESGQRCGFVSGGCLEKDLCRRVWSATQSGPRLLAFDTRGNSVSATRYNTGCEGIVYVLCQRVDAENSLAIDVLDCVEEDGMLARLLTVYRSEGTEYAIGDMLIEMADQRFVSRSGLTIDDECEQKWLGSHRDRVLVFHDHDGDQVEAAVEILHPPRELVVFGAGDDAIPLVRTAAGLGWRVTVVGKRPELANRDRFANLVPGGRINVRCNDPAEECKRLKIHVRTDIVVMTHDFDGDLKLLPRLLDSASRYIGLLGPKRRLAGLIQRLYEQGRMLNASEIDRIRSPIGLDIGAVSPAEIAISIVAELIAVERDREGGILHQRRQPLHEPAELVRLTAGTTP